MGRGGWGLQLGLAELPAEGERPDELKMEIEGFRVLGFRVWGLGFRV